MNRRKELLARLLVLAEKLPDDRLEGLVNSLTKAVYTVEEVAGLVGVHRETIRRAIRTGRLIAFRIGGDIRAQYHVTAEELQRFMAGGRGKEGS